MPDLHIPDVNVLVALTNPSHQHHDQAHEWLAGTTAFATTPITESGLVRLLLNPAVTGQDVSGKQALAILEGLRADHRATFLSDATSLADPSMEVLGLGGHRQVTDFHLTNLAAANGAVVVTFDRRITGSLAAKDHHLVLTL